MYVSEIGSVGVGGKLCGDASASSSLTSCSSSMGMRMAFVLRNPSFLFLKQQRTPFNSNFNFNFNFNLKTKKKMRLVIKCAANSNSNSNQKQTSSPSSVFSVTSSSGSDFDYLGQSTKGDFNLNSDHFDSFVAIDGHSTLQGPIEEVASIETQEAEILLKHLGIPNPSSSRYSLRGIFCSRTLNLRSISAIGYDMDYTLMHYNVMAWEGRAYDYCMENLKKIGFPVDGLAFDPDLVIRGLVIDKEKGNLVKADRFGYIKRAMHGTEMLSTRAVSDSVSWHRGGSTCVCTRGPRFESRKRPLLRGVRPHTCGIEFSPEPVIVREPLWHWGPPLVHSIMQMDVNLGFEMYGRELVDLRKESRWEFLNTLFSVSEAVAYMQAVGKALFRAHVEGQLKSEIMSKPELFVEPDPDLPLALLDQKEAGKKLLLITNSDFHYTDKMMQHSFNRFLPNDMGWRDLFDIVIVSARKPEFFQMSHPMYEVVTGEGLMRPCFKAQTGGLYSGGSAQMVENYLNIHGDEILYVGDHIYTDVSQSKVHLRWRTALICRELEDEYRALIRSRAHRGSLIELINQKEVVGDLFNQLRLALQRRTKGRPAQTLAATNMDDQELTDSMQKLLIVMRRLDEKIATMLEADGELFNKRYADIYTSRVSNFLHYTPFMYFRSQEQTLAHDSYGYYPSKLNGGKINEKNKRKKQLGKKSKYESPLGVFMGRSDLMSPKKVRDKREDSMRDQRIREAEGA
ncbi:hypothetical protein L484_026123 [Morus notabilis]|uniref:Cytosolic purine 5'-nucleotidase n=1 Tax=Morus notabilis TaxID=981085 RepID=W9R826_9ROSA|nr:hypothetical protein L484_026123 [Morus notabilis]